MGKRRLSVQIGVGVALSLILGMFCLVPFPSGGQVSLDMVPLLLLARLRGLRCGLAAGVVYGVLHTLQEPFFFHPLQVLLDYPLAFGLVGLAGIFPLSRGWDLPGVLVGITARYLAHLLSGAIFIDLFLPGSQLPASPWLWSMSYNLSFMLPSAIICLVLVPVLAKAVAGRLGPEVA